MIGRKDDTAAVRQRLLSDDVRLLTLSGPPGVGKTRLALEVAAGLVDAFEDGIAFVDLTPVDDPSLLAKMVSQTLEVRPAPGQSLDDRLNEFLAPKHLLLILDNFEQILAAAPRVADLLTASTGLKVLVTSRERLHLRWEREFPVPTLPVPDLGGSLTPEAVSEYAAVALFVERARAVRPDFAVDRHNARAVAEICAALDGLPLAIELAAARSRVLTPMAMLLWLQHRLRFLAGGPRDLVPRHRTLGAAIEWSYRLLDAREQALFRRLSAFVGGCSVEAAATVSGLRNEADVLDALTSLIDKNLLQSENSSGETRFRMLATVQEFASEALATKGEFDDARRLHAEYFLALAERSEVEWPRNEREWLARVGRERPNIRAVLQWFQAQGRGDAALRLAVALGWFWRHGQQHFGEGRVWLDDALKHGAGAPAPVRGKALMIAGELAEREGSFDAAQPLYEHALDVLRDADDRASIAFAYNGLARVALLAQRDYAAARSHSERAVAVFRELGDHASTASALVRLSGAAWALGDDAGALRANEEALSIARKMGKKSTIASALHTRAEAAYNQDDPNAERLYEEALSMHKENGNSRSVAITLNALGRFAVARGDSTAAQALHGEALSIAQDIPDRVQVANALNGLGHAAWYQGDPHAAYAFIEESLAMLKDMGHHGAIPRALADLGRVVLYRGDRRRAVALFEESLSSARPMRLKFVVAMSLNGLAMAAEVGGEGDRALRLFQESLKIRSDIDDKPGIAECLEYLAALDAPRDDVRRPARFLGAADSLREAKGTPRPAPERQDYERTMAALLSRLGPRALAVARGEGRSMPLAETIRQALAVGSQSSVASPAMGASSDALAPLSPREQEVAALIARGLSNREIATGLTITEGTAQNHVQHILDKLGLSSRTQIATWAVQHGLFGAKDTD